MVVLATSWRNRALVYINAKDNWNRQLARRGKYIEINLDRGEKKEKQK